MGRIGKTIREVEIELEPEELGIKFVPETQPQQQPEPEKVTTP